MRYVLLCHHMLFFDPVQEDHTAFSSADGFSDFVARKMLLVVECWNSLNNFLSKSRLVIVCLPGENASG